MENLNHRVLGIISIFKLPYKISPADRNTIDLAFTNLIRVLPGFFKCLEPGQPSDVVEVPLGILGTPKYSQRYLLVIKRISDIIGTQLYCRKILDKSDNMPIEQISIIGPIAEVTLMQRIAQYIYHMNIGIAQSSRFTTRGVMNGKQHQKKVELEVYMKVYNKLYQALLLRKAHGPENGLEIRNKKVFDYIRKFLKLEYNKKNNPLNPSIENARSLPGQFKIHKLL